MSFSQGSQVQTSIIELSESLSLSDETMPKGNARACQKKHSIRVSHLVIHINESWLSNTLFLCFVFLKLQFISNEIMPKLSVFNQTVQAQKDTRDHYQGFPFRYNDFS